MDAAQTPKTDLIENYRKCWYSSCNKSAWFETHGGWCYCLYHVYFMLRWGGGRWFEQLRFIKLRNPKLKIN